MAKLGKFLFDIFIERQHIIADKLDGPMYSKGLTETCEQKRKQYTVVLRQARRFGLNPSSRRLKMLRSKRGLDLVGSLYCECDIKSREIKRNRRRTCRT